MTTNTDWKKLTLLMIGVGAVIGAISALLGLNQLISSTITGAVVAVLVSQGHKISWLRKR
jgi:hypothetical protein